MEQQLDEVNRCAFIHYCIETKKCKWGTPDKKGLYCLFYEQKIKNYKEKKVGKVERSLNKLENKRNKKVDSLRKKIIKLTKRIHKIDFDHKKKVDKLIGKEVK